MAKMDDSTIRSVLKARRDSCVNHLDSEYSRNRREALSFYNGDVNEAYGDNEPGMSQVVSRDTLEAIESILPALIKPFIVGDETVRFEPTGPEDEEGAKQATEYVNYIFERHNPAFEIVTSATKDGLLNRLGVAKAVYETTEIVKTEKYEGLDEAGLLALQQQKGATVQQVVPGPMGFDATVEVAQSKRRVRVYPIAPDEFLFERHLARLEDATFLAHITRRTIADLIDMGLDKDKCLKLTNDDAPASNSERTQRFSGENPINVDNTEDLSRIVSVTECYARMNYDGKGKLSWRRVILGGASDEILLMEDVDDHPFVAWTPIPVPHKLVGLSIHDLTRDIQILKTALVRETLNNLYLANRPMREIVEGQVNIDDVLTPRVGGVIRVKTAGSIREIVTPLAAAGSYQMIEYADTVREQRTGSTRYNQGLDANSLNKTATGITSIMNAAGQRMEMIARQFAEQFMRPLFRKMLELVCKHQDKADVIRLRNQWVPMDPREWSTQYDMTVAVGLGTGDKTKMTQDLMTLLQLDERIVQLQGGVDGPLLTMENVHEKLKRLVESMGLKGVERYYADPESQGQQPQLPKPDPNEIQAKADAAKMQAELDKATAVAKIKADADIEIARINAAAKLEMASMDGKVAAFDAWAASLQQGGHDEPPEPESTHGAEEYGESPEMQQAEMQREGMEYEA